MKRIIKLAAHSLIIAAGFISCKKELTCEGCNSNKSPIAKAGADQAITLPKDTTLLDGSGSTDADGTITTYKWAKIAGPVSPNIINANSSKTSVKSLVAGVYQFELTVTDDGGLFSKDTVQVKVNVFACNDTNRSKINVQLIPIGTLSQAREGIAVASAGNKILFAGGGGWSSRVDIYNITTNSWSTAELSIARGYTAAVAAGSKVFFGGGAISDGTFPTDNVDIFDVATNTWTVAHLSTAGSEIAAATVGNKVFFAGGDGGFARSTGIERERTVDIYDLTTNAWSRTSMSEGRLGLTAVAANNKVYFAGGRITTNGIFNSASNISDNIDIYDNASNSWSTSSLKEPKTNFSAISTGDKIYWAGGYNQNSSNLSSCLVEIKDVNTGSSIVHNLFNPALWWPDAGQNAVVKDGKIFFYSSQIHSNPDRGDKFDIYDITTNTWSIGVLPLKIVGASIISVNNTIYLAGGEINGVLSNQVWKLEF